MYKIIGVEHVVVLWWGVVDVCVVVVFFCFSMIRRPPRSTQSRSSAASDVYKRQVVAAQRAVDFVEHPKSAAVWALAFPVAGAARQHLSLIHISEPTRPY